MNSNLKGEVTEARVRALLLALGYSVVLPGSVHSRWDIGWDEAGQLVKIQCKTGRVRNGCIRFNASSRNKNKHYKYLNDVHYFAIYVFELDKVYLIPMKIIGSKIEGMLRIEPTRNHQEKNILWAKDFELTLLP